jgi:hypothetical protein
VNAAFVGDQMVPRIVVEVQNHSPVDFFFSTARFTLESGKQLIVMREAAYGLPVVPEKIASGNGKSVVIDLDDLLSGIEGDRIANAFVVDKIERRYFADPKHTEEAILVTRRRLDESRRK